MVIIMKFWKRKKVGNLGLGDSLVLNGYDEDVCIVFCNVFDYGVFRCEYFNFVKFL